MFQIGNWEISDVVFASFVVLIVISGAVFFLFTQTQKQINIPEKGVQASYGFSTIKEVEAWTENGAGWADGPIDGKSGIVVLHPVSVTEPRYIQKTTSLPSGSKYRLEATLANIAGKAKFANSTKCDDSIIALSVKGAKDQKKSEIIVNAVDGWVILPMDVSEFAGQDVTIRVEGKAGGPCGDWAGEWNAVDKLEIASYK